MYLNQPTQNHIEIAPADNGHEKLPLDYFPVHTVIVVAAIFQAITVISLLLHLLYGNFGQKKETYAKSIRTLWNNIKEVPWTIAADIFAIGLCCLCIICALVSRSQDDPQFIFNVVVPAPSLTLAILMATFCFTALMLSKISAAILYKSFFWHIKSHVILMNFYLGYLVLWWLAICGVSVALPIRLQSDQQSRIPEWWENTRNLTIAIEILLGIDAMLNLVLLMTPLCYIFRLNQSLRRRICVALIFAAGCFCFVSSIARLVYLVLLQTRTPESQGPDSFACLVRNSYIWTMVDACLGIVMPFWPFRVVQKAFNTAKRKASANDGKSNTASKTEFHRSKKSPSDPYNELATVEQGDGVSEESSRPEETQKVSSVFESDTIPNKA